MDCDGKCHDIDGDVCCLDGNDEEVGGTSGERLVCGVIVDFIVSRGWQF